MQVLSNGALLRTIPITTGEEPGFTTRSGVKVIIEKFREKRMNSETVGIDRDEPRGLRHRRRRVRHAGHLLRRVRPRRPWSVGAQGYANVSHGCTGMSTANAAWLYNMTLRGDVVEYTGTDRPMTLTNGYGDWNASLRRLVRRLRPQLTRRKLTSNHADPPETFGRVSVVHRLRNGG